MANQISGLLCEIMHKICMFIKTGTEKNQELDIRTSTLCWAIALPLDRIAKLNSSWRGYFM